MLDEGVRGGVRRCWAVSGCLRRWRVGATGESLRGMGWRGWGGNLGEKSEGTVGESGKDARDVGEGGGVVETGGREVGGGVHWGRRGREGAYRRGWLS